MGRPYDPLFGMPAAVVSARIDMADMNTMTATPIETAATMKIVCIRPSFMKRIAAIHSKGVQGFMESGLLLWHSVLCGCRP